MWLTKGADGLMPRGKEQCPQCGSKKIAVEANSKKCGVCGYQWTGKIRRKTSRKDKVRF
jgi:ribosomal protein S27AE